MSRTLATLLAMGVPITHASHTPRVEVNDEKNTVASFIKYDRSVERGIDLTGASKHRGANPKYPVERFKDGSQKIVGGAEATAFDRPWMASLQTSEGIHFCGGSLIAPNLVLTAAHCVGGGVDVVALGRHNILTGDPTEYQNNGTEKVRFLLF